MEKEFNSPREIQIKARLGNCVCVPLLFSCLWCMFTQGSNLASACTAELVQ